MENDRLAVTIDDLVQSLSACSDKKYKREIIWQGDPTWWKRQAPILFPNVGKYYGGEYLYQADIMFRISMVLPEIMSWNGWKRGIL